MLDLERRLQMLAQALDRGDRRLRHQRSWVSMSFVERSARAIAVSVGLAVPVVGKLPQPTT